MIFRTQRIGSSSFCVTPERKPGPDIEMESRMRMFPENCQLLHCKNSGIAENCNSGQGSYGKTIGKSRKPKRGWLFYTGEWEVETAVEDKRSTQVTREFQGEGLYIGCVVTVSHWLGRRKTFRMLLGL